MLDELVGKAKDYFNPQFASAFAQSAEHTIHHSIKQRIVMGRPSVKREFVSEGDIIGSLLMTDAAEKIQCRMQLSFRNETAFYLMDKMLGESVKQVSPAVKDLVGEMTNMIYCHARKILNETGSRFIMGIPQVRLKESALTTPKEQLSYVIPFVLAGVHDLWVEISVFQKQN